MNSNLLFNVSQPTFNLYFSLKNQQQKHSDSADLHQSGSRCGWIPKFLVHSLSFCGKIFKKI